MNFDNKRPIYLQIADRICDEILAGVYVEGGRIPSVREYAVEMQVNANTTAHSYAYLEQQGIIEARRGQGYFVSSDSKSHIKDKRRANFFELTVPHFFNSLDLLDIDFSEIENMHAEYARAHEAECNNTDREK